MADLLSIDNAYLQLRTIVSFEIDSAILALRADNVNMSGTVLAHEPLRLTAPSPSVPWFNPETGHPTPQFAQIIQRLTNVMQSNADPNADMVAQIANGNEVFADLNISGSRMATLASNIDAETGFITTAALSSSDQFRGAIFTGYTGDLVSAVSAGISDPDVTITIAPHTRITSDGRNYQFNGGSIASLFRSKVYYIYTDIAEAKDTTLNTVTYKATTEVAVAFNGPNRIVIGTVTSPAAGSTATTPPGFDGDLSVSLL